MPGLLLLVPLLFATAPDLPTSELIEHYPTSLPQSLFFSAADASGYWYCDRSLKPAQARAFDKRYGARVLKIAAAIEQKDGRGWSEGDIIITSCRRSRGPHQRATELRRFGQTLDALEQRYLGTTSRPASKLPSGHK